MLLKDKENRFKVSQLIERFEKRNREIHSLYRGIDHRTVKGEECRREFAQVHNDAEVISYCSCECKTIDIQVDENMHRYEYIKRIPVELKTLSSYGISIIASLHVINGYISELEVYRADSKSINST